MNLLKRGQSPGQRHTSTSSTTSNQTAFIPGSPQNVPTQNQISPQQQHNPSQNHQAASQNHQTTTPPTGSSAIPLIPLSMGGEHSAFRALNPSTAALLAASAQLGLARSYAASLAHNNNVASSTSTNQSPPMSPHPSESDEEINVHDESDADVTNHSSNNNSHSYKKPLELTKHDRN
jgi:paired box protein 6